VYGIDWDRQSGIGGAKLHRMNSMPTPFEEIDTQEFMEMFFGPDVGTVKELAHRTTPELTDGDRQTPAPSVTFYGFHGHVLAVAIGYIYLPKRDTPGDRMGMWKAGRETGWPGNPKVQWDYMRFFRVGCKHERMKEVGHAFARKELALDTWGMFCHVYHCPDCGYHYMVDSSG
jgi:hypothetical protein